MTAWGIPAAALAQTGIYELVSNWPNVPSGMFFGSGEGWPDRNLFILKKYRGRDD